MTTADYRPPKKRAKPQDYEGFCIKWYEARGCMAIKVTNFTAYGKHDLGGFADVLVSLPGGRVDWVQVTDSKHLKEHIEKYACALTKKGKVNHTRQRIQNWISRGKNNAELFICDKDNEGKAVLTSRYRYEVGLYHPIQLQGPLESDLEKV